MGKGSSSSQANQSSTTRNEDSRVTNGSGIVAQQGAMIDLSQDARSWDSSTNTTNLTNISNSLDPEVAKAAFDFATNVDATSGQGLTQMLAFGKELTGKSIDSATSLASLFGKQSSDQAARYQQDVLQAFDSARTTTPGGIDNKTMIILGVAAAGALAVVASKKG